MNWIGSERGQGSTSQQRRSRINAQPGEGEDSVLPCQQQPAGMSFQPSHPPALPAIKLAIGQLWLSRGKHTKKDVVLSTQLAAPSFGTSSILQHNLAPASHSRLKFTVQHTLTEIWSDKIHCLWWIVMAQLHHQAFCFKTCFLSVAFSSLQQ